MAEQRITATAVNAKLDDHLIKHKDVYDPRSEKMSKTLYGEQGSNGLAGSMEIQKVCMKNIDDRLSAIEGYIKWLILLVMGAIIGAVLNLVIG